MSSEEPLKDVAAGMTQGFLEYSSKQVKTLVRRLHDRDISFIEDQEIIALVREQRGSSEWRIYKEYVKDGKLRLLVQLGLTLRTLEASPESLQSLRDRIVRKFGTEGLHIAQFVQNEVLSSFFALTLAQRQSQADMTNAIESLLNNVDRYGVFIQTDDDPRRKAKELGIRLQANLPETLILFGSKSAKDLTAEIARRLEGEVGHAYEMARQETRYRIIFLFSRKK